MSYHDEVIEEEDLPLVGGLLLGLVYVGHFKEATAAHQSPMGDGQHLAERAESKRRAFY